MNFSKFDIMILVTMSFAVIIMSFAYPALGLTDQSDEVSENDVPEFNMSASTLDLTGQLPEQPDTPTSGTLSYNQQDGNSISGVNQVWIDRPKDTGTSLELQNTSTDGFDVVLINFTSATGSNVHRYDITGTEGQEILIQDDRWTIRATVTEINNYQQSNMTADVRYEIESEPGDASGLSSIPLIGGISDAVANILGYIASQIAYVAVFLSEIILNAIIMTFNVAKFLFSLVYWLGTTYGSVVSAAPSWAAVVLTVPSLLLFAEFAKMGIIVIKMLPTT